MGRTWRCVPVSHLQVPGLRTGPGKHLGVISAISQHMQLGRGEGGRGDGAEPGHLRLWAENQPWRGGAEDSSEPHLLARSRSASPGPGAQAPGVGRRARVPRPCLGRHSGFRAGSCWPDGNRQRGDRFWGGWVRRQEMGLGGGGDSTEQLGPGHRAHPEQDKPRPQRRPHEGAVLGGPRRGDVTG